MRYGNDVDVTGDAIVLLNRLLEKNKEWFEQKWTSNGGQLYAGPTLPTKSVLYTGFHID